MRMSRRVSMGINMCMSMMSMSPGISTSVSMNILV